MNTIIDNFRNSSIVRCTIWRDAFAATDTATGRFDSTFPEDHRRLENNHHWCQVYCRGRFRRRLDMAAGRVRFEFEEAADAAAFRTATGRVPSLITCR
jgi:hypothetical protein